MALKGLIICILTLVSAWTSLKAQAPGKTGSPSNLRRVVLAAGTDSLRIDSLSLVPGTVIINNIPDSAYSIDHINAMLYWKQAPPDSVTITYRVFPFRLNTVTKSMDYDSISYRFYQQPFRFGEESTVASGIFDFGNLQYNGSLGRAISFGNNQDAVVNSNLNLTLDGMLGDSIEISAAITDNNLPIQPDGSTQQLNEFDQVFLQFRKRNWQLNLGDIDIRQNQSYFLKFYKRLQGISFQTRQALSPNSYSNTLVSGSIAKGKFTRNIFQGLEGNQGPYRLTGANNEFFFIVLANTERVFIDGELLQRGEDQDYIINYNTAEITFTPRRMITKDSRIQVEFEYADRNFLNANLYLSQEFDLAKKLKIRIGAFQNSDAKNSPINQVLDDRQKFFLSTVGDSIQNALYPSATLDTLFDAGKILYEKVYYNPGTGLDSFYRYSTDPSVARYALSFIDLGPGRGNYEPDFNGANGKVYRFIAPSGTAKQGRFEPVQVLVTPKKQQVMNLGMDWQAGKKTSISSELAMSNYDANTYSSLNDGDDIGLAGRFRLLHVQPLKGGVKKLDLETDLGYEYVQAGFRPVERLRQVEFSRDWGLSLLPESADEHILRAMLKLTDRSSHSLSYQLMNYRRGTGYQGLQQNLQHDLNKAGWLIRNILNYTDFKTNLEIGSFLRPQLDISREFKKLAESRVGVKYTLEENKVRNRLTDTLSATSFSFDTWTAYIRTSEKRKNRYMLQYFTRSDKYPVSKDLLRADKSWNIQFQAELLASEKHRFFFNTSYRKLKILNPVSPQKPDGTVLGRMLYQVNEWKGLLNGDLLYELGTGQEQRRDFVYFEVPAGTGQYAWIDYNSDGVQQLNEFEEAAFPDQARFIRIFTPTNQFVKANFTTLNYNVRLNPRAVLVNKDGKQAFLSRFLLNASLQVNKKSIARGNTEFSPFKYELQDTALITLNTVFLNVLSFNRFSSTWGFDLSNLRNSGKSLLTYGYESRRINDWLLKLRWIFNRSFSLDINSKLGLQGLYTPSFANRNYELRSYVAEPRLVFIQGTRFRLSTGYKFDNRKNHVDFGGEESINHSLVLETKYNILQSSSVNARFTFSQIKFPHPFNTTVSYIMLDGLLPGTNLLWNLDWTKRLLKNLELNLQYEGRKPGSTRSIHTGRAAVRALF